MTHKKHDEQNPLQISIWEQEWSQSDYNAHHDEFKKMRQEYRTSMGANEGNAVLSLWQWFEKEGAVRIDYLEGDTVGSSGKKYQKFTVVVLDEEKYRVASFKREKYCSWVCVQEKIGGLVAPSYEKMARQFPTETKVVSLNGDEFKDAQLKVDVQVENQEKPVEVEEEEVLPEVNF